MTAMSIPPSPTPLAVTEQLIEIPERIAAVDLTAEFTKLIRRCAILENRMQDERQRSETDQRDFLLSLLDVCDAIEKAGRLTAEANPAGGDRRLRDGLEAVQRLLLRRLARVNVTVMNLAGRIPAPAVADIVGYVDHPDLPDETVLQEVLPGYWRNSEVLRRAKVIVVHHNDSGLGE